jgi:hypothetical protein
MLLWIVAMCYLSSTSYAFVATHAPNSMHGVVSSRAWMQTRPPLSLAAAKTDGDPIRAATGIRPSLHPVTLNALAHAMKVQAQHRRQQQPHNSPSSNDTASTTTRNATSTSIEYSDTLSPLHMAQWASQVAVEAIAQRQTATRQSNDNSMLLTTPETHTIVGRVVGVLLRRNATLEPALRRACASVPWIAKYKEWDRFGVLPSECVHASDNNDNTSSESSLSNEVDEKILQDPLFALARAESCLALYLHMVEQPELQRKQASVPDQSRIDFLDDDRRQVLLQPL